MFQPRSICFNLGQFDFFFCFCGKQKIFLAPSIFSSSSFLSSSPLYLPHLLFPPPCSPTSQPVNSFYLNAYLGSLEPQTLGFPLDSGPDALPLSHVDLDASSTIFFNYIYTVVVINFLKLFKSDVLIKENNYTTHYYTTVHVPLP